MNATTLVCFRCKCTGHRARNCPRLRRVDRGWSFHATPTPSQHQPQPQGQHIETRLSDADASCGAFVLTKVRSFVTVVDILGVIAGFLPFLQRLLIRLIHSRWNLGVCDVLRCLALKKGVTREMFRKIVATMPEIRALRLSDWRDTRALADLQHVGGLESLDIGALGCCSEVLGEISQLSGLTSLRLGSGSLNSDEVANGLTKLALLGKLTTLRLFGGVLNNEGLKRILQLKHLRALTLPCCYAPEVVHQLPAALPMLTALDLTDTANVDNDVVFQVSTFCRQLTSLSVAHSPITDEGLTAICSVTGLTTLALTDCIRITDRGLSRLPFLTHLSTLTFSDCGAPRFVHPGPQWPLIPGLGYVFQMTSLTSLDLSRPSVDHSQRAEQPPLAGQPSTAIVTSDSLHHVSRLTSLTALNLQGQPIDDDIVVGVATLNKLTDLNLSCACDITDSAARAVCGLVGLVSLNLAGCARISNDGLANIYQLRGLTRLNIDGIWGLTEVTLARIGASLPALVELKIGSPAFHHMTDAAVAAHLSRLPNLKALHIRDQSGFPRATALRRFLPWVDIGAYAPSYNASTSIPGALPLYPAELYPHLAVYPPAGGMWAGAPLPPPYWPAPLAAGRYGAPPTWGAHAPRAGRRR